MTSPMNTWRSQAVYEASSNHGGQRSPPTMRMTRDPSSLGTTNIATRKSQRETGRRTATSKRSNRFPNCSYFTNWKNAESDRITWNVQVLSAGTYDVDVYYACPQDDVGSIVELQWNDSRLQAKIDQPHDPPVRGQEHDRLKRMESYVKDFKPLRLGSMHLQPGSGELVLKAKSVAGDSVMEFRLLMFTRVETE